MEYERDSKGEPFLSHCVIYHFYLVEKKKSHDTRQKFFSLWEQVGIIVKAPPRQGQYLYEPIKEVIQDLEKRGYKWEKL